MTKIRLDKLLHEQANLESREIAQRLIMAGSVRIGERIVDKPGMLVSADSKLDVTQPLRFVSRGGEKLLAAFETWHIDVTDSVCADVGSSTGGFTDCLLQHGARKIYAIDVGKGILHWKLRQDPRVIPMEETNARYLTQLPEPIDWVTVDASFISLCTLLPAITIWNPKQIIMLIKPQFEAGQKLVGKGGVVRDPSIHRATVKKVLDCATGLGWIRQGEVQESPLRGPAGNVEFLAWIALPGLGSGSSSPPLMNPPAP